MGSVFKKAYTKPMPVRAEIVVRKAQRLARWRDAKGKIQTAPITVAKDGTERLALESSTYFARYRDGSNFVVECSTGCRDEAAARTVLADLERQAERIRAGILSPSEVRTAEHPDDTDRRAYRRFHPLDGSAGRCADAPGEHPPPPGANHRRLRLRPTGRPRPRTLRALARHRDTGESVRTLSECASHRSRLRSAIGARNPPSADFSATRSRGCQKPMRRPTLAVSAGR